MNNRDRLYKTQIYGINTVFNHITIISSDVQSFKELSNLQSLKTSISSSGNHYCCTSLPLKMIKRYKCRLLIKIYSMIIVHLYRPGSFLKVLVFSTIPNIRSLALISYIKPVSSIFYRSAYITFLIAGKSKNGNYI